MAEEKKDLAVQDEEKALNNLDFGAFAEVAGEGVTGLEEINEADIKLPTYKLLQSTSQEAQGKNASGKAGQFYNVITGEAVDELKDVSILYISKSRSMFPAQFTRGDKVLCMSEMGGVYKRRGVGTPRGGLCANCEYSQWGDDNTPPPCKLGYVILAAREETGELFRIHARGSSVAPTKNFLSTVVPKLRVGGKTLGIYILKVDITSVFEESDKGSYYRLEYTVTNQLDSVEKYNKLNELAAAYKDMFFEVSERDIESGRGEDEIEADYEVVEDEEDHGGIL